MSIGDCRSPCWHKTASAPAAPEALVAACLRELGTFAELRGELDRAKESYEAGLRIAEGLGDRGGTARALSRLGVNAYLRWELGTARARHRASLALYLSLIHISEPTRPY